MVTLEEYYRHATEIRKVNPNEAREVKPEELQPQWQVVFYALKDLQNEVKGLREDIAKLQLVRGTSLQPRAVSTPDFKDAVTASGSITATSNTAGLAVAINNDWRTLVQFRATLGGAGNIYLEASLDGVNYYTLWTKSLTAAGSYCDWDLCAFPYFRVRVPTTGIDVAIDIRAVKV